MDYPRMPLKRPDLLQRIKEARVAAPKPAPAASATDEKVLTGEVKLTARRTARAQR